MLAEKGLSFNLNVELRFQQNAVRGDALVLHQHGVSTISTISAPLPGYASSALDSVGSVPNTVIVDPGRFDPRAWVVTLEG